MKRNERFGELKYFKYYKRWIVLSAISITLVPLWYTYYYSDKSVTQNLSDKEWTNAIEKEVDFEVYRFKGLKLVHLDLKGAPPRVTYFEQLFPLLSNLGANGLLIEYEDMFPYKGLLRNISALNSYTFDDVEEICKLAKSSNLSVVPLIQTIGYLEFVLKLKEFEMLRAVPDYPQVICPNSRRSFKIIFEMIDQVIRAHPQTEILHIGAGDISYIAQCDESSENPLIGRQPKSVLFLAHVGEIAKYIRRQYPSLRILMWDDELRSMSLNVLKDSELPNLIEPVIWKYSKDVYTDLGPSLWQTYMAVFPKLWISSAFKGATGSNQFITDVTHYLQNHRSWLSVVSELKENIYFEGIIITGRQRYDHFSVLCELLPVSISSLALSLRLLLGYDDSPLSPPIDIAGKLQCSQPYGLLGPAFGSPSCSYPGADILENFFRFHQLKEEYENIIADNRYQGWLNDYNVKHTFSNPRVIEGLLNHLQRLSNDLADVDRDIIRSLSEIYDVYTVNEWRETYILPLVLKIRNTLKNKDKLLSQNYWPRRPLKSKSEL